MTKLEEIWLLCAVFAWVFAALDVVIERRRSAFLMLLSCAAFLWASRAIVR